jgi:two-component system, OmpR family, response regulator CpxR
MIDVGVSGEVVSLLKGVAAESVLIVDDDAHLCEMLRSYLAAHGWSVIAAHTGADGIALAREQHPDLIILDVMLPDLDGFEVLRRLHLVEPYKVLMLTARGEEIDRIVGLEMGADDYLGKPFNPRELMARMKAILRRAHAPNGSAAPASAGAFQIDAQKRQILYQLRPIQLTDIEFTLLQFFLNRPHEVLSRDDLSQVLFERPSRPFDRAVDMHVSRLRRKLEDLTGFHGCIRSIRNAGYLFVMDQKAEL